MIDGYLPQNAPWAHQATALERMRGQKFFALLMAMRTGKSYVTTTDFGRLELAGEVDDLMIVAPAGVYRTWEKDFQKHASLDLLERTRTYTWSADQQGVTENKRLLNFLAWRKGPRFLLINIEAMSSVKRARELAVIFAGQRRTYGAVDEATTIKNIDSQRSDFVNYKLRDKLEYRRILTGLPTPRSPLDLFGEFWFLSEEILGFDNYVAFEKRYAEIMRICMLPTPVLQAKLVKVNRAPKMKLEGIGWVDIKDLSRGDLLLELERKRVYVQTVPKLKGYRNEEELAERIKPYSFRIRLEDCYDMPPKTYAIREVSMTKEQRKIYDDLKKFSTAQLSEEAHVTPNMVLTRMLRLHQVLCGHVVDDDGEEHEIPENRTQEVLNLLQEYDGKAIIWCTYDSDINKITEALRKEYGPNSVSRFWGGNRKTREQEEAAFLTDPERRFMAATPAAGGKGRTWTNANLLVYYSNNDNLENRIQSEDRGSGVDKKDFVNVVDIVVPGTVDMAFLQSMRDKILMSNVITGDNWRQWVV